VGFQAFFEVRGVPRPQPKARAFARRVGNRYMAGVFSPKTATGWKWLVVQSGEAHRPARPLQGPIFLAIDFFLPRPRARSRRKDFDGEIWAPSFGRNDVENLSKALIDALTQNGWWRDDGQVVSLRVNKLYHAKDGVPGASVAVGEAPDLTEKASVALCRGFEEKTASEASREKSPYSEAERP
jgi:Holliday junction resolvase RusA-like endonuclease